MYNQTTPFTPQSLQLEQYTTPRMSLPTTPYLEPSPQPKLSPMINPTQHPLQVRMYSETPQQPNSSQIINPGQHFGMHVFQPPPRQDDPYRCNFLGQLAGSYEIQTPSGVDKVSVIVPDLSEIEKPYAIVRRVCADGEALPDQFIYEEQLCFSLCSVEREVYALMPKGINMKYSVKWNLKDGGEIIWKRKEVVFSLVSVDSLSCCSRRNSINSLYSTTSTSAVSHPMDTHDRDGIRNLIRPELRQMCSPLSHPVYQPRGTTRVSPNEKSDYPQEDTQVAGSSNFSSSLTESKQLKNESSRSFESRDVYNQQLVSSILSEEKVFAQIKAECLRCPSLLKRLVSWASANNSSRPVTRESNRDISVGRLWVTARSDSSRSASCSGQPANELEEKLQDALDDIKGAYQEIDEKGVWQQPVPQAGEPGLQHRLLRDSRGFWMIQERISDAEVEESEKWVVCARELSDERWVDVKNDQREIEVRLLQMVTILEKMKEQHTAVESADVQKSYVEFLFKTCNQKKLNTKLKKRNLKHNIANLKVKLDKQYKLSFAVKVATTAEAIVQELGE